jgi:2,3-bisphosphoglycerate-dependent phosphoglycerate mutase
MTTIYLVRNADFPYSSDTPVEGQSTSKQITHYLMDKDIDLIYSSPCARAMDTIKDFAEVAQKEILLEEKFKERIVAKEPVPNFEESLHKLWTNPTFSFEGGESNEKAQLRGIKQIAQLLLHQEGKNIVISTHGNLLALLLHYYDKQYDYLFWKNLSTPDIYKLSYEGLTLHKVERIWQEPFHIRTATVEDAMSSLQLMNKIDSESSYMLYSTDERTTSPEQHKKRLASIEKTENTTMLLAIDNQTPVGYLMAIGGSVTRTKHSVYLVVGILASHTNKGIGGALFREVEKWARSHSVTRMELSVMTNNEPAIHLYKKRGFEIEGMKKQAFLVDNEYIDACEMAKLLS